MQLSQKRVSPSEVLLSQASKQESADGSLTALSPQPVKPLLSLKPETLSLLRILTGHKKGSVFSMALSPNGQTLASGSGDGTIKLWNLATGQEVRTLSGHTDSVYSVALSPDGQTLASGSGDHTIKIWGKK